MMPKGIECYNTSKIKIEYRGNDFQLKVFVAGDIAKKKLLKKTKPLLLTQELDTKIAELRSKGSFDGSYGKMTEDVMNTIVHDMIGDFEWEATNGN